MVSEDRKRPCRSWVLVVLILVLMEYGLGAVTVTLVKVERDEVLILVLMEYGLGDIREEYDNERSPVLILVLMEYGLGAGVTC